MVDDNPSLKRVDSTPKQILKKYWGYDQFRPSQEELINTVLNQQDALALLPTGGGKSVCYQIPGLLQEGLCIVVTPLIALMQDQVEKLKKKKIAAIALYGGMSSKELDVALDNCAYGHIKFLYLSPERIHTPLVVERLKKIRVSLIAVDESHCISEWGYDFRPDYLKIALLREMKPEVPMMALTATATDEIVKDIINHLTLRSPHLFRESFARKNISFVVRKTEDKERLLLTILQRVEGSAIIYMRSRNRAETLSKSLSHAGVKAACYHAGMAHEQRKRCQHNWLVNTTRVVVATSAFGMGIDKPDVRLVVHIDIPETIEAYYQEAGRAGRDGQQAYAVLLYQETDIKAFQNKIVDAHPSVEQLKKTYQALANYFTLAKGSVQEKFVEFNMYDFCQRYNWKPSHVHIFLKKLEQQQLIELNEGYYRPSRVHSYADKKSLYAVQLSDPRCDYLIKSLFRLYGAELFVRYVSISEQQLATMSHETSSEVRQLLQRLHTLQLINYEPSSDTPQFRFSTPRHEASMLPLDKKKLLTQQKQGIKRGEIMLGYVTQRTRCRMQYIQLYFAEKTLETCGHRCDVCIDKKKQKYNSSDNYKERIRMSLEEVPMTVSALQKKTGIIDQNQFSNALREMLETQEVGYDEYWMVVKK